jgi:tetratricopeptide (TPR) repeat protein
MARTFSQRLGRLWRRELPVEDGPPELVFTFSAAPPGSFGVHVRTRADVDGAQGLFRLPWDDHEVAALLGRLRGCGRHVSPIDSEMGASGPPPDLRQAGRALFDALFLDPEVRRRYEQTRAATPRGRLRLRLVIDPEKPGMAVLHALPWEILFDAARGELLAVGLGITVVRTLQVRSAAPPFEPRRPLRVLALLSGAPDLDLERERRELETVAREARGFDVRVEPATDLSGLEALLFAGHRGRPFHALHLAGHGGIAAGPRGGVLAWEPPARPRVEIAGRDLSTLLRRFPELRLVVLNACTSAELPGNGSDPFAGVAAALLQGGVPVVVAIQGEIRDQAAVTFSRSFYGALAAGRSPEDAMGAARWELWKADPTGLEWAKPVLFQGATPRLLPRWLVRAAGGVLLALVLLCGLLVLQQWRVGTRTLEHRVGEAEALLLDDRPAEAARLIEAALDHSTWPPVSPAHLASAHATAAVAAADLGDLEAAVEHAAEAARLEPERAEHRYNLGALLARSGRPGDAARPLRRALELDPGLADASNELGCVLLDLARPEEARRVLAAGVDSHPEHALLHKNLGRALLALGRAGEASRRLERALALLPAADWPERAKTSFWLARSAADQGDDPAVCAALARFRQADAQGVTEHAPDADRLARAAGCTGAPQAGPAAPGGPRAL